MKKNLLVKDLNNVNGEMQELQILIIIIRFVKYVEEAGGKIEPLTNDIVDNIIIEKNEIWNECVRKSKYGSILTNGFLHIAYMLPIINPFFLSGFERNKIACSEVQGVLQSEEVDVILTLGIKYLMNKSPDRAYDKIIKYINIDPCCNAEAKKCEWLWAFCEEFCQSIEE